MIFKKIFIHNSATVRKPPCLKIKKHYKLISIILILSDGLELQQYLFRWYKLTFCLCSYLSDEICMFCRVRRLTFQNNASELTVGYNSKLLCLIDSKLDLSNIHNLFINFLWWLEHFVKIYSIRISEESL